MNKFEETSNYADTFAAVNEIHEKLLQYILKCSNSALNERTAQKLSKLSAKLIQTLLQYSIISEENESPVIISQEIRKILSTLVVVSQMPEIKTVLVRNLAPVVFETVSDPCINGWCGSEILKNFNVIIQNSDKNVRHELIADNNLMHLYKLVDLLSVCGDYNYQTVIVECIYRMCSKEMLIKYSNDLIPEDEELRKSFLSINNQTFDGDVRTFLNILNEKSKSVYSIVSDVFLDDVSLVGPSEYKLENGGLWVDFNIKFKSISWYVDELFYNRENHELLILPAQSVESAIVEMFDNNKIRISFQLKGKIISESGNLQNLKYVHLIMKQTGKAELIVSEIVKQIIESDFNNQNDVVFQYTLKGPQTNKSFAVHRETAKKKKFFSKEKYHALTESLQSQADVIEITSDESISHSQVLPALNKSKSSSSSSRDCLSQDLNRKRKFVEKSKSKVIFHPQYQPTNARSSNVLISTSTAVSPESFKEKVLAGDDPIEELKTEYYTAQIDCPDDRNRMENVKDVGLNTNKLMLSKHAQHNSVTSETVINKVVSVDSDIQIVSDIEQLKSTVSTMSKSTARNRRKTIQDSSIAKKIPIAKAKAQISSCSKSDDSGNTESEILSEIDLLRNVNDNDKNSKKAFEVDELETPDGVEVAEPMISLDETPEKCNGLSNEGAKSDESPVNQAGAENLLALQLKAVENVDDNQHLLNEEEIKQSLSQVSTVKLSTKHRKSPTTSETCWEDECVNSKISKNQNLASVHDEECEREEEEVVKSSQIPTKELSSTGKESQLNDCVKSQIGSQTKRHKSIREEVPPFLDLSNTITNTAGNTESEDINLSSAVVVNKSGCKRRRIVSLIKDDTSSITLSEDEDSASPVVVNRKQSKGKRIAPIIEDENESSEEIKKQDNIGAVSPKIVESNPPPQEKDIPSGDNLIGARKSPIDVTFIPVATETLSTQADKKLEATEDASQKKETVTQKCVKKLTILSSQIIQTGEAATLSPVIVMDRIKLKSVRNQGNVKQTDSKTRDVKEVQTITRPETSKNTKVFEAFIHLEKKQKGMVDVKSKKITSEAARKLKENGENQEAQEDLEEVPNETVFNVTKTTTASSKRRKLFVPGDLSYLESLPKVMESNEKPITKTILSNNQTGTKIHENVLMEKYSKGVKRKQWNHHRTEYQNKSFKSHSGRREKNKILVDMNKWLEAMNKLSKREEKERKKAEERQEEKGNAIMKQQKKRIKHSVKRNRTSYKRLKFEDGKKLFKKPRMDEEQSEIYGVVPKEKRIRVIENIVLRKATHSDLETATRVVNKTADHQSSFRSSNEALQRNKRMSVGKGFSGWPWEHETSKLEKEAFDFVKNW